MVIMNELGIKKKKNPILEQVLPQPPIATAAPAPIPQTTQPQPPPTVDLIKPLPPEPPSNIKQFIDNNIIPSQIGNPELRAQVEDYYRGQRQESRDLQNRRIAFENERRLSEYYGTSVGRESSRSIPQVTGGQVSLFDVEQQVKGQTPVSTPQEEQVTPLQGIIEKGTEAANPEMGARLGLFFQDAAALIDAVTSTLSARKQADVMTASGALTDALAVSKTDLDRYKIGLRDYYTVRYNIEQAQESINRLASTQKGIGKLNLRYWLGGGYEIEKEIAKQQAALNDLRIDLEIAKRQRETAALPNPLIRYNLPQ